MSLSNQTQHLLGWWVVLHLYFHTMKKLKKADPNEHTDKR